jgi:hypothetical protein
VSLTATPAITTDYRLATPAAAAGYVRVKVMPLVTLGSVGGGGVQGTESPILPDAPVLVQTQNADLTWAPLAQGTVAADGTFSVPATIPPGATVRVVVTPGRGYAPATTAPQVVAR